MVRRAGSIGCAMLLAVLGAAALDAAAQTQIYPAASRRVQPRVRIHRAQETCDGTTLFADLQPEVPPRLLEVDMAGDVVWEFEIPPYLRGYTDPGMDVEALANGNVLFVLPRFGVFEVERDGRIVWFHRNEKISHDADRLENGNTLYVYGGQDDVGDLHVKEIEPDGTLVWSWSAGSCFAVDPYLGIEDGGWTHTNAVTRLENGNTLVNLRNFDLTVEIDPDGRVEWQIDWRTLFDQVPSRGTYGPHDPEALPDNRLLVCLQWDAPYQVVEIDRETGRVLWSYHRDGLRTTRDADRLPNGNTLIVGVLEASETSVVFEVTPEGRIVWELALDVRTGKAPGWFYKAERILGAAD